MAANRFATLIHRRTNRITLVLVYAFLEWALIFFILLHALLSYFILRFADYFGLKRPCLFCSRLDRFFDASGKSPSHTDLLCDDHALEIRSKPLESMGFGQSRLNCEEFRNDLSCCCEEKKASSPLCTPIEPDLGFIDDYTKSTNLIGDETQIQIGRFRSIEENVHLVDSEEETEEKLHEQRDAASEEEFSSYVSSFDCNKQVTRDKEEEEDKVDLDKPVESSVTARNLEFYIDDRDCHLIPVEFYKPSEEIREMSDVNGDFILDFAAEEEDAGFNSMDQSKLDDAATNLDDLNDDETDDAEVSIGTEIPDHDQIGDIPSHQHILDHDDEEAETLEFRAITLETRRPVLSVNEERLLENQGSMESLHSLHNAMFRLDRRTESLDDMECCQGTLTVDKLKLELEEERKALNALYEELEEERSASATAASETMAMINRLHEEKAAIQMEALQYQRMMEEQSEYDQEALQLMNELMVKREKENAELEKDLEVYRKRLEEYKAKEEMGMLRRRMRDSSLDSDENNGELHNKNVRGVSPDSKFRENEMENTPVDVVLSFDECLDDYEGERLSILGRLKFLEEKITELNDDEKVKTFENNGIVNGNGHYHGKETNGKHRVLKSKRLLPLFDAVDGEMENGVYGSENGEIVTVEEEVDDLYERLEALEADREFLRHCVGSLQKGDKGVHLLHQILQQLRDLRNIDLIRIRENGDMMSF